MTERIGLLGAVVEGLGPSRWHPLQRRKWRRLMSSVTANGSHPGAEEMDRFHDEQIGPWVGQVCADLSEGLPDGFEFRYDVD